MPATDLTSNKLNLNKIREDLVWLARHSAFYQVPPAVAQPVELPELSHELLDELPSGLDKLLSNIRGLGTYFESLVAIYIKLSPHYSLKARNVQVIDDGKTLGEFDFIVHNHQLNQVEHWEAAVKFYLKIGNGWFGPNLKDNLRKKYTHLLEQQLSLSEKATVKAFLDERAINIAEKKLLTRGALVIHHQDNSGDIPRECCGNADRLSWYRCNEIEESNAFTECRFYILNKLSWIGLPMITNVDLSLEEFVVQFKESAKEVMMVGTEKNNQWQQFFVVKDSWLARAQALPY